MQMGQSLWDFISQCEIWHVWLSVISENDTKDSVLSDTEIFFAPSGDQSLDL